MFEILGSKLVSDRVFYPRSSFVAPTDTYDTGEVRIACYHERRHRGAGTILHFHGNGELASDYWESFREPFLDSGLNVCFVEYRGYGASGGAPNLVGTLNDNMRVVEKLGIPAHRLVVYGRSLGSLFALDVAHRLPAVGGVVLESGIAEFLEDWPLVSETRQLGKTTEDLKREVEALFDNRGKLERYPGHLLVMHARNDTDLDPSHAVRLHGWSKTGNRRLVIFPDGDHSTILAENSAAISRELSDLGNRLGIKE